MGADGRRSAQIAVVAGRFGERVVSVPLLPFPVDRGTRRLRQAEVWRRSRSLRSPPRSSIRHTGRLQRFDRLGNSGIKSDYLRARDRA